LYQETSQWVKKRNAEPDGKIEKNFGRNGALGKKFDAYPKRQFVTESININSLAYHHIWSTIKTLPATLPELRSGFREPSALHNYH
jgi:hypothetical protein